MLGSGRLLGWRTVLGRRPLGSGGLGLRVLRGIPLLGRLGGPLRLGCRLGLRLPLLGKLSELGSAKRAKIPVGQRSLVTVGTCGEGDLIHRFNICVVVDKGLAYP